jgi:hypothetical protein
VAAHVAAYVAVFQLIDTWHVYARWYTLPRQHDRVLLGISGVSASSRAHRLDISKFQASTAIWRTGNRVMSVDF